MPELTHTNCQLTNNDNGLCENGFWSKHPDEIITCNRLHKFWSELSPQARQNLLKVDKQTVLEQARKNMYCSRCNGLLLKGFMQILMYGKSSQPDETGGILFGRKYGGLKNPKDGVLDLADGRNGDNHDPATHPWGGLTTAKDGTLTVLSTYIDSKSLKGLQNVFDSARARERQRQLLYPDACGGGGRGWISRGMPSYGRVHVTRETCALHTARISCDTLADFWSALGEETRQSLLRMKEEDFVGRLMSRFDSKRFCRDCRKNVIREFKELKGLKRSRSEPHCTRTFCAADSIFKYEVFDDAVRADWSQTFMDSSGTYHHFEWAIGSGEGKSDILEFENVGMNKFVNVDGLDLRGLSACYIYITLRAWKHDGRCTELSVKAHALKGRECVHSRLIVGDGFISITMGESIIGFFEHAEEAEEEDEDDDVMNKDGNELDGECSRPQKHAKSPELAREFLLDAATVIFKDQVEKAFREGNACQNAHSIFVCLVLKLLEERVHDACKEIITLEKQAKLLEEEEKEKEEEEERRERKRMKEREKKQKRKERLKGKERCNDKDATSSNSFSLQHQVLKDEQSSIGDEENVTPNGTESSMELIICRLSSPNKQDQITEISSDWNSSSESWDHYHSVVADSGDYSSALDECDCTTSEHSEYSFHGDKFWKDDTLDSVSKWSRSDGHGYAHATGSVNKYESRMYANNSETYSRSAKGLSRQVRVNGARAQPKHFPIKHGIEKFNSSYNRVGEKHNSSCSCTYASDYKVIGGSKVPTGRAGLEESEELKSDSTSDKVKQDGSKTYQSDCMYDSRGRSHSNMIFGNNGGRDLLHTKMVWEPLDSQKKHPRRNSESNIAMLSSSLKVAGTEKAEVQSQSINNCFGENVAAHISKTPSVKNLNVYDLKKDREKDSLNSKMRNFDPSGELQDRKVDLSLKASSLNDCCGAAVGSDSNSENSSNLSERDSNLTSSNTRSPETTNSSDSEDSSQQSGNKEIPPRQGSDFRGCRYNEMEETPILKLAGTCKTDIPSSIPFEIGRFDHQVNSPSKSTLTSELVPTPFLSTKSQVGQPTAPNQSMPFPMFHQALSSIGYYHPSTIIWPTGPASGLMAMPQLSPYVVSCPLNYGWNGNPGFCMPYGGVSHLEPPVLSQGVQHPIYHPVSNVSGMHLEEKIKISKPVLSQEVSFQGHNKVQQGLPPIVHSKDLLNGRNVQKLDLQKAHVGKENNNGFSLFHFGGPVALSSTLKEGKINELALNNSVVQAEVDHVCSKNEATVEEYSLFASSNGFKFSF